MADGGAGAQTLAPLLRHACSRIGAVRVGKEWREGVHLFICGIEWVNIFDFHGQNPNSIPQKSSKLPLARLPLPASSHYVVLPAFPKVDTENRPFETAFGFFQQNGKAEAVPNRP